MASLASLSDVMTLSGTAEDRTHRRRTFSGVLSACACSICLVIIIVFSTVPEFAGHSPVVWGLEAMLTTIAAIFTYVMWVIVHKYGEQSLERNTVDVTIRMKLGFLWLFGIINILNSAINMAIVSDCIEKHGNEEFPGELIVSVVSHIFEIIFNTGQLGFISSYCAYRLRSSSLMNYGISTIILTHIVRWFRTLFMSLLSNHLIDKHTNHSHSFLNNCYWTNDLTNFRRSIESYIEPTLTEYSLLAVSLMLRMWIIFENETREPQYVQSCDTERTPLLSSGYTQLFSTGNIQSTLSDNSGVPLTSKSSSMYICILMAIVLCLPLLTTIIMVSAVKPYTYHYQLSTAIVQCVFKLELFVMILLAFFLTYKQYQEENSTDRINSSRFILILCTAGTIAYSTFGLIAGLFEKRGDYATLALPLFIQKFLEIACTYLQTILILQSSLSNIVRVRNVSRFIPVYKIHCVLFTVNIIMWLVNSYIGKMVGSIMHIEANFYGENYWKAVNDVIFPITIFYRFHTAMEVYQLYKKYENLYSIHYKPN